MKSPFIYIPDRSIVEVGIQPPAMMMQGFITWRLLRKGRVVRENPFAEKNKLVTSGLNQLATQAFGTVRGNAAVGTGSAVPAATDTALQAEVSPGRAAAASPTSGYVAIGGGVTEDYYWYKSVYTFIETQANGNLTEFGLFNSATSGAGVMWCRHLFKDVGGIPTTIVKTSDDQLEVTYELRLFPPVPDSTQLGFALATEGSSHDITYRPAGSTAWSNFGSNPFSQTAAGKMYTGAIGARLANPAGTVVNASTATHDAYVANSLTLVENLQWAPASGSSPFVSGTGWSIGGNLAYQMGFSPSINKTNLKKLTFKLTKTWGEKP